MVSGFKFFKKIYFTIIVFLKYDFYVYQIKFTYCKGMSEFFERESSISKKLWYWWLPFFSFLSTHTRIAFFYRHCIAFYIAILSLFALNLLVNATIKKLKSLTWNLKRISKTNKKYNKNERHISERKKREKQFPSK